MSVATSPTDPQPGARGPAFTVAGAYEHCADLVAAAVSEARRTARPGMPVLVRVERIEHLAAGMHARAQEARGQ